LKRKIGYDEVNDEAEKRSSAGNRSIRAMEVATEEGLTRKHCTMEVDNNSY
jgi:hypothetical protein